MMKVDPEKVAVYRNAHCEIGDMGNSLIHAMDNASKVVLPIHHHLQGQVERKTNDGVNWKFWDEIAYTVRVWGSHEKGLNNLTTRVTFVGFELKPGAEFSYRDTRLIFSFFHCLCDPQQERGAYSQQVIQMAMDILGLGRPLTQAEVLSSKALLDELARNDPEKVKSPKLDHGGEPDTIPQDRIEAYRAAKIDLPEGSSDLSWTDDMTKITLCIERSEKRGSRPHINWVFWDKIAHNLRAFLSHKTALNNIGTQAWFIGYCDAASKPVFSAKDTRLVFSIYYNLQDPSCDVMHHRQRIERSLEVLEIGPPMSQEELLANGKRIDELAKLNANKSWKHIKLLEQDRRGGSAHHGR